MFPSSENRPELWTYDSKEILCFCCSTTSNTDANAVGNLCALKLHPRRRQKTKQRHDVVRLLGAGHEDAYFRLFASHRRPQTYFLCVSTWPTIGAKRSLTWACWACHKTKKGGAGKVVILQHPWTISISTFETKICHDPRDQFCGSSGHLSAGKRQVETGCRKQLLLGHVTVRNNGLVCDAPSTVFDIFFTWPHIVSSCVYVYVWIYVCANSIWKK